MTEADAAVTAPASLITLADLETDPHPVLARLRAAAPVSWVPVLGAWLVTGYDLAVAVLRDARTFTVDDPRFSTAKVVGPSMLSLDGAPHARHRGPFNRAFRHDEVHARLAVVHPGRDRPPGIGDRAGRRGRTAPGRGRAARGHGHGARYSASGEGTGPIRRGSSAWYDGIVAAVQAEAATARAGGHAAAGPAGTAAFAELAASLREVIAAPGSASLLAQVAGPLAEAR